MKREEEKAEFVKNYLEQFTKEHSVFMGDDTYETSAEKEDIADACLNAIDWAERTLIDKVINLIDSVRLDYYAEHTDELIDKIKRLMEE